MKKERKAYFDNAKFILIFLVVFGHFAQYGTEQNYLLNCLYNFIYLFHMPAFIFISGYFSNTKKNKDWLINSIFKFIVPYLIFQTLFLAFMQQIGIHEYEKSIITPAYVYWYFFAMFVWNIALKYISKIKIDLKYLIIISFTLGIITGYFKFIGYTLSLSRIIVFFPFFIIGYYFKKMKISPRKVIKSKILAIFIMIIGAAIIYQVTDTLNSRWLYGSFSYMKLDDEGINGALTRFGLYGIETIMMFAFFALVPKKVCKFTHFGSMTVYIYALHIFIVETSRVFGLYNKLTGAKILLIFGLALCTVYIIGKITLMVKNKKEDVNIIYVE